MSSAIIVQQPQTVADTRERDRLTRNLIIKNASPDHIALALGICDRYGFDPLLKHIAIIGGNIYVTRDGLIHLAHASGQFDGIEVVRSEQSDRGKWRVTVAVHRRDMRHPFVYTAIQEEHEGATGPWQKSPHAMTQKCAEVMGLRRAFDVSLGAAEEVGYTPGVAETNIGTVQAVEAAPAAVIAPALAQATDPNREAARAAHAAIKGMIASGEVPADVVTRRSEDRFGRAYNALTGPERVELLAAIRVTRQPELDGEDVIDALFEDRAAVGAA